MAEMMTNFTAGDMPGGQKTVKKAVAPKKASPAPTPAPAPEATVDRPAEPTETVEPQVDSTEEESATGE